MIAINKHHQREEWIAHLTDIAYRSLLQRGFAGSFLDLELSLWREIRQSVERTWPADNTGVELHGSRVLQACSR